MTAAMRTTAAALRDATRALERAEASGAAWMRPGALEAVRRVRAGAARAFKDAAVDVAVAVAREGASKGTTE